MMLTLEWSPWLPERYAEGVGMVMILLVPYLLTTIFSFRYPYDRENSIFITGVPALLGVLADYLVHQLIPTVVGWHFAGTQIDLYALGRLLSGLVVILLALLWALLFAILGCHTASLLRFFLRKLRGFWAMHGMKKSRVH